MLYCDMVLGRKVGRMNQWRMQKFISMGAKIGKQGNAKTEAVLI